MNRLVRQAMQLLLVGVVGYTSVSEAYDLLTHEAVNVGGALESTTGSRLLSELGFAKGVDETISGKRVIDWIREGGSLEDNVPRFLNHFHYPLRSPWRDAGLKELPFFGMSSILWGQTASQDVEESFSWINAREAYFSALTHLDKTKRGEKFGETFRALGQVMHLVADASVPAHARNDAHLGDPYEKWVERQVRPLAGETRETARQRFLRAFAPSPFRPDDSFILNLAILGQDAIDAPVPIARLWDTDRYNGTSASITLSSQIGISEYANANFFSEDTVFSDQRDPGNKHFSPLPSSADVELFTDPSTKRTYWRKRAATSDEPQHLAVVSKRFFWQQSSGVQLPPRGRLDESVHEDYARLLLPRAVGYSASLLDYFFRGQLDVDVLLDPDDSSVFRVVATNGSKDDLVNGTLTLYRDDPTEGPASATRTAVTSAQVSGIIPQGQDLFTIPPSIPALSEQDAERSFLAVYKGTLGQEVAVPNQDPSRDFPGGVIGKVVGGVRVEEVFLDGAQWKLRTPKGVFLLPGVTTATFEDVRWGDGDNLLVARTSFGLGQPNRFVAYEIQRQAGSVEPVTTTPAGGPPEVLLSVKTETVFPPDGAIDLGATVTFTSAFAGQELVGVYDVTSSKGADDSCNTAIGSLTVSTLNSPSATISGSFRVVLDLPHEGIFGTAEQPYIWYLQEVAATVDGRLLGLVVVFLTTPEESATVSTASLDEEGNLVTGSQTVFGSFPSGVYPLLWALVDLQTLRLVTVGEIPVTTAKPSVTLTVRGVGTSLSQVYARVNDGCSSSPSPPRWVRRDLHPVFPQTPIAAMTPVSTQSAIVEFTLQGWMKDEFEGLGLSSVQLATSQGTGESWYECAPEGCYAIRFNGTTTYLAQYPRGLQDGRRSRPALAGERFAFVASVAFGFPDTVVGWDPGQGARVLLELPGLGESAHILGPVTGPAALVTTVGGGFANTVIGPFHIVSLDGSEPPTSISNENFNFFTLLNPRFLYNASDLRFYRQRPSPQATVLPLKLSDLPDGSNPIGDYHAIRVPGGSALSLLP